MKETVGAPQQQQQQQQHRAKWADRQMKLMRVTGGWTVSFAAHPSDMICRCNGRFWPSSVTL